MPLEDFVIDVQLYEDETKKPTDQSVILLPVQNITTKKNQLLLKWSNRKMKWSQSLIAKAVELFISNWEKTFSLYPIERVFLDYTAHERLELLITFDASRLYSNTQIRNIKTNAPKLLNTAMDEAYNQYGALENQVEQQFSPTSSAMDYDRYEKTNTNALSYSDASPIQSGSFRRETSFQEHQDMLDKQQRIYELEQKITENSQVIKSYEMDLQTTQREYELKISQVSQENDTLKQKIISYQDNEIDFRQQLQMKKSEILDLKNTVNELNVELEQGIESWKQKLQQTQFENEELRMVITENQQFEEQVQVSLNEATLKLKEKEAQLAQLEQENAIATREWQMKNQQLLSEQQRLQEQQDKLDKLLSERQTMVQHLSDELNQKEQELKKLVFEHQQAVQEYQHQSTKKEKEFAELNSSKNEEIQRLSQRLEKQQHLVNQLMDSQETTQSKWQDNYNRLETNYRAAASRVFDLEKELAKLKQSSYTNPAVNDRIFSSIALENDNLPEIDTPKQPIFDPVEMVEEEDFNVPEIDLEETVQLEDPLDQSYHYTDDEEVESDYTDYDDDDYSYDDDYDYDEDYSYDDDYDYDGYDEDYDYDDDVLGYDEESVMDDVDSILSDTEDEEGKEKIRKKEYVAFESQLDELSDRWSELKNQDNVFKKWAEPKMKKFDRFYKKLDDNVKAPKFLSRSYVMTEEVWGEIQAYALISRHLKTILDYEN
ncbi:hypothetical protein JNUCC83_11165 [Vagococcus sp. JNUCC 83]